MVRAKEKSYLWHVCYPWLRFHKLMIDNGESEFKLSDGGRPWLVVVAGHLLL
jgi:hypothetical protein